MTAGLRPIAAPAGRLACRDVRIARMLDSNKTRQGYARKRILKPAGYFFVRREFAALGSVRGARLKAPSASPPPPTLTTADGQNLPIWQDAAP